jgi:peptide/nickel transport system substrate-binding protein
MGVFMKVFYKRLALVVVMAASTIFGTVGAAAAGQTSQASKPTSLSVAEVTVQWPSLDPATDSQTVSDSDLLNAVYGELFVAGPNSQPEADEATGYAFSKNHLTVTITLRKGLKFSNGDPFTSSTVVWSIQQDLLPANGCSCISSFGDVTSVTASGPYAVELHLQVPLVAVMTAFLGSALDYTADPIALASMGASAYGQDPVGAGPFKVVSNTASATLKLTKNPAYWQKGHPYLDSLTFTSVGTPETAYLGLESGEDQVITGPLDPSTEVEARTSHQLVTSPGSSTITVELNSSVAPWSNILAREAVYYAINPKLLLSSVGLNIGTVSESFGGPGSAFHEKTVSNYRTYNLKEAQKLVSEVGASAFTFTLYTTGNPAEVWAEGIANELDSAGMNVTAALELRTQLVSNFISGNWSAVTQLFGAGDPSLGTGGTSDRLLSNGEYSGTHSPTLDKMLEEASQLLNVQDRQALYYKAWAYLNQYAYAPFIVSAPLVMIVASADKAAVTPSVANGDGILLTNWANVL